MDYLTDHRADHEQGSSPRYSIRKIDPLRGKLYNETNPIQTNVRCLTLAGFPGMPGATTITTYCGAAWTVWLNSFGEAVGSFDSRICVDTAPLLERSTHVWPDLGWIGKNTCLINQQIGVLVFPGRTAAFAGNRAGCQPPPDRCGTCTRCIDACPTAAIVPAGTGFTLDSQAVHLLLHHRTARPRAGGDAGGSGQARFRLRHLPGRLPLEPQSAGDGRAGFCSAALRARRSSR